MTTFLQKIAAVTRERLSQTKKNVPVGKLQDSALFLRAPQPVLTAFKNTQANIIAEIKFASPSEKIIHTTQEPSAAAAIRIADEYLKAGACMLSVLTEPDYFKGHLDYLKAVRDQNPTARLLRKDFMVDPYQLIEARAYGADAILLIVAMTEPSVTKDLYQQALALGLTPLIEVHDEHELAEAISLCGAFIGVNNRNLKTLKIDLDIGRRLSALKPAGSIFICESGLSTAHDVCDMKAHGYDGFLMGSAFMRQKNPGNALYALQKELSCV